jgi:hypothetical protein
MGSRLKLEGVLAECDFRFNDSTADSDSVLSATGADSGSADK